MIMQLIIRCLVSDLGEALGMSIAASGRRVEETLD
jgi:hypothetical protein